MADQFSKMYDVERVGGDQRTRLAEMLRANALNQPQGQMVSGWYVKPHWSQQLAPALGGVVGTLMGQQVEEERKAKTAELLRQLSQGKEVGPIPAVQNFNNMERMGEGQTPMPQQAPTNELERITRRAPQSVEMSQAAPAMIPQQQQRYVPLTEEEKIGKVMELAQYNPYAAQIWSAQDTARQNRLMKLEDVAAQRQWQAEQNQMNREGRMDLARLSASIAASNRVPASEKPLTEYQGQSVLYGTRAAQSNKVLDNVVSDPTAVATVHNTGMVGNFFAPENVQKTVQAQRDFLNAVLRRESGATISPSEFKMGNMQYFPQPGDKPGVLEQKKANRDLVIKGFATQSGPAGKGQVMEVYNAPYAIPQVEQQAAPQGRLGGLTPPNTQVKFLGFEKP